MVKVRVVGAAGYGGVGAVEILSRHPEAEIVSLVDVVESGKRMGDLYPALDGACDLAITSPEDDSANADVVLFATPDRVAMAHAQGYLDAGCRIIDYSGDFRFNTVEAYAEYASRIALQPEHAAPELLADTAYGLAELHRDDIHEARIVGNPGCFAVSAILGAAPAVKNGLVDLSTLIVDAKTGVSGAGKKANPVFHYPHRYEEMNAYRMCGHQHVMEIERELGLLADRPVQTTFTAQVVPVVRGIMTTIYGKLRNVTDYDSLLSAYMEFYRNESFVRVIDEKGTAGNRHVRGTNRCVLWVNLDRRTNTIIVVAHIDNLVKGQAGSAVQNMNVLFDMDEKFGLNVPGMYP